MNEKKQLELISYLQTSIDALKRIKVIASEKNKTLKIKAVLSMLSIIEARMDASLKYCKAGGYSELDVTLQSQMYNPIIEWLTGEIA